MTKQELILGDSGIQRTLADRLAQCPEVARYDSDAETEASTLAHAFGDLEESFRRFLDEHLQRLIRAETSCSEMVDVLLDIGEEFRHILYHIHDPKFYRYLESSEGSDASRS